ncbi:MAG: hypothetical protein CL731_04480 [Chloroflexi bacterium]|nr:hypothetical protein [Chloroflexota bacterium]|tara:strand:+ start:2692 stop:3030 length:339 start_codon:yes stop_codon:yes gene_type:complete
MGMISLVLSVLAMVAALASVWFTSETIKKANSSNQKFYEANVKGMVQTLEDLARNSVEATDKIDRLEKAEKKDVEKNLTLRIQDVENSVSKIRALIEELERFVPGCPKQMNF